MSCRGKYKLIYGLLSIWLQFKFIRNILLLYILFNSLLCQGQESVKNHFLSNSVFIELAGNSIFYGSLNYERVIIHNNNVYFTGRLGLGYGHFLQNSIKKWIFIKN